MRNDEIQLIRETRVINEKQKNALIRGLGEKDYTITYVSSLKENTYYKVDRLNLIQNGISVCFHNCEIVMHKAPESDKCYKTRVQVFYEHNEIARFCINDNQSIVLTKGLKEDRPYKDPLDELLEEMLKALETR